MSARLKSPVSIVYTHSERQKIWPFDEQPVFTHELDVMRRQPPDLDRGENTAAELLLLRYSQVLSALIKPTRFGRAPVRRICR